MRRCRMPIGRALATALSSTGNLHELHSPHPLRYSWGSLSDRKIAWSYMSSNGPNRFLALSFFARSRDCCSTSRVSVPHLVSRSQIRAWHRALLLGILRTEHHISAFCYTVKQSFSHATAALGSPPDRTFPSTARKAGRHSTMQRGQQRVA